MLVFGMYAFGDDAQESKVTTNGIAKDGRELKGKKQAQTNSNLTIKSKITGKKEIFAMLDRKNKICIMTHITYEDDEFSY